MFKLGWSTQYQPSLGGERSCYCYRTFLYLCICTFVHWYICAFVPLYIHTFDARQAPLLRWSPQYHPSLGERKLTTGQQSHRRSRPMFMFNPDPTSNVQMCNAAIPHVLESVQILCHLCSRQHQLVRQESDPMSDQMGRLPIKFVIKPAQHEVTLHVHAYIISRFGTSIMALVLGRVKI